MAAAVLTAGLVLGGASAQATTPAHPYSDPVWYPLRGSVAYVDCVRSNPGCHHGHSDQAITLLSGIRGQYHHEPIYAAGAGILHVGAVAPGCASSGHTSLGNWVWIDHGGGRVSRYGHLYSIDVADGAFVTPRTRIGKTGDSGEARGSYCHDSNHGVMYLNFRLTSNGVYGTARAVTTLKACSGHSTVAWPATIKKSWTTWNSVPKSTRINATSGSGCVPSTPPATANKPATPTLSPAGSGRLTLRWKAAVSTAPVGHTRIELRIYHPTIHRWGLLTSHELATTARGPLSYTYRGLSAHRRYAARISFHTRDGWSRPSLSIHRNT